MDGQKDTLLFIDPVCPRPYDPDTLEGRGIGGTEQTLVAIAEGLGALGRFNVVVEQHNRLEGEDYNGHARYTHPGYCRTARWVVTLRDPRPMVNARERFPDSTIYLYSHDLADRNLGRCLQAGIFEQARCDVNITVSNWHRTQTIDTLRPFGYSGQFKMRTIYNPLGEDVVRTNEPYDKNKLIWLASPHKGIAKAYEIFKYLLRLNPSFKLYVTNPGYAEDAYTSDPVIKDSVIVLGTIPHGQAIAELRNSLCLFYPNNVFPETFGKIMAEANQVGTPVITSPLGAAREVLDSHPGQIADCRDVETVVKRVMKWYEGERPFVIGNPRFRLAAVLKEWIRLLYGIR